MKIPCASSPAFLTAGLSFLQPELSNIQFQNFTMIVAVYIQAGVVAGIMVNNEIKRGVHYLAGEIGHMAIALR